MRRYMLLVMLLVLVWGLGLVTLSHAESNTNQALPKIKVMVFEFHDLTGTGAGEPIPRYIVRVLGMNPKFDVAYVQLYKLANQSVQGMIEYAKSKGYDFIISGRVTDSNVSYHSASVPTPWGGVSVRNATAKVSFLAGLRAVDGTVILEKNFSGTESVSNVGGWAWTSWGYVDIYSDSFLNSPMGKALDKAAKEMLKAINEKMPEIQKKAIELNRAKEQNSNTESSEAAGTAPGDKYERVKVYENDFSGVSLGTTFIKGLKQLGSNRVSTTDCGGVNCPDLRTGRGVVLKMDEVKMPFEVEVKVIRKPSIPSWGKFSILLGKFNFEEGRLEKGLMLTLFDPFESGTRMQVELITQEGKEKVAYRSCKPTDGDEFFLKVTLTQKKLKVFYNDQMVIDMDLPEELLEQLPKRYSIGFSSDYYYLRHIIVNKLKVKSETTSKGSSTDKIADIIASLRRLGAEVEHQNGYVLITFNESALFTGATSPEPSEDFEDILDTVDDLVIALGADSLKVKVKTKYTASSEDVTSKEKELLRDYLEELASDNYKVKVLKGGSSQKKGTVVFKIREE